MNILFVSNISMFDACLSLIRALSNHVNVNITVLFEVRSYSPNKIGLSEPLTCITKATEISELSIFSLFLNLDKTYLIDVVSFSNFPKTISQQIEVVRFSKQHEYDIAFFYSEPSIIFLPFFYVCKKKISLTVHDPILHSGEKFIISFLRCFSFKKVSCFFLLNNNQKVSFLKKYGISSDKVYASSLSIYEYLNIYSSVRVANQKKVFSILFFGRIQRYKGVDILLAAYERLLKHGFSNVELVIAGSGNFDFDMTKFKDLPGIKLFNRFISDPELVDFIVNSSVVVCPYKDATQSGVVMSAYALCKPVIVTKVGGLSEMVDDNETGFIISPNDINALYNKLEYLIGNPIILDKMCRKIREKFYCGKFSWAYIADVLYLDLLKSIKGDLYHD